MRAEILALPNGQYEHAVELDGVGSPILLHAVLAVEGDSIHVDWSRSSPQSERGINETYNHAYAMTVYPIKCALAPEVPNNEGSYRPVTMNAPEGSIINARYPAAVASRQILGHAIPAVIFGALAQLVPYRVLADSGSPSPRVVFSGVSESGRKFGAALLLAGGMGAQASQDGLSATPYPSNAAATSVEVIESRTPLLFRRRALIPDSGGDGRYRGGLGVETRVELRAERPAVVSVMTDRIDHPPVGSLGGGPGRPNVIMKEGQPIDSKARSPLLPGEVVSFESAGGAGFGPPLERDPALRARDIEFGYVTEEPDR
jgi:N-methylhydantoinase B